MKILVVCGSRSIWIGKVVTDILDKYKNDRYTHLMHGGAGGVDRLAGEWASSNGMDPMIRKAEWKSYGRAAGPIRNKEMATEAHTKSNNNCMLVAIWDGDSAGTKQMYDNWNSAFPQSDWGKRNI